MVLIGGAAIPVERLGLVGGDAEPALVKHAEIVFGGDVALRRGGMKPRGGAGVILHQPVAARVEHADIVLRRRVAGLGPRQVKGGARGRLARRGIGCRRWRNRGGGSRCLSGLVGQIQLPGNGVGRAGIGAGVGVAPPSE